MVPQKRPRTLVAKSRVVSVKTNKFVKNVVRPEQVADVFKLLLKEQMKKRRWSKRTRRKVKHTGALQRLVKKYMASLEGGDADGDDKDGKKVKATAPKPLALSGEAPRATGSRCASSSLATPTPKAPKAAGVARKEKVRGLRSKDTLDLPEGISSSVPGQHAPQASPGKRGSVASVGSGKTGVGAKSVAAASTCGGAAASGGHYFQFEAILNGTVGGQALAGANRHLENLRLKKDTRRANNIEKQIAAFGHAMNLVLEAHPNVMHHCSCDCLSFDFLT
jgi:hypothetical protein